MLLAWLRGHVSPGRRVTAVPVTRERTVFAWHEAPLCLNGSNALHEPSSMSHPG